MKKKKLQVYKIDADNIKDEGVKSIKLTDKPLFGVNMIIKTTKNNGKT